MELRTRQLIRDVRANPWRAISWKSCRKEAAGEALSQMIDDAIFEKELLQAFELACIYRGLAKEIANHHIKCKSEACLGSVLRSLGHLNEATLQMQRAEQLAGSCDDCLGSVYWRWAVLLCHQRSQEETLKYYDRSLMHLESIGDRVSMCRVFVNRSWACGCFHLAAEGFGNVKRGIDLIAGELPPRIFVTAGVNALASAVSLESKEKVVEALEMIERLKKETKGLHIHAKVRPMLRWIRGLAYEKLGDIKNAVRAIEYAISGLDRFGMIDEKKAAMADLARIRRKGKQLETNDRHIRRLIEECLRLEQDPEILKTLERARREPSEENLLAWRTKLDSRVPCLEPETSAGVIA
jgi:tetratricopeptide (TPR) repeat protein